MNKLFLNSKGTIITNSIALIFIVVWFLNKSLYNYGIDYNKVFALHSIFATDFKIWQIISHFFVLSGGFFESLVAIVCFFFFGSALEIALGSKKTLLLLLILTISSVFSFHIAFELLCKLIADIDIHREYYNHFSLCGPLCFASLFFCLFVLYPKTKVKIGFIKKTIRLIDVGALLFTISFINRVGELTQNFDPGRIAILVGELATCIIAYYIIRYWKKSGHIYVKSKWF